MSARPPYAMRLKECPTCGAAWTAHRFPPGLSQRAAALGWLAAHPKLWKRKEVVRYAPMRVSPAWRAIARGLKRAGIYSPHSCDWDMRIGQMVQEVRAARSRALVGANYP